MNDTESETPTPRSKLRRVRLAYIVIKAFVYVCLVWPRLLRLRVTGRRNIPRTGPVIVAANHLSDFDAVVVAAAIRRDMTFLAADFLFRGKLGGVLRFFGHIPVYRWTAKAHEAADAGVAVLRAGGLVVIFPEGRCSPPDGVIRTGKTGVAHMAALTGATVVPVGIVGTDKVVPLKVVEPRGPKFRLFRRVRVTVGPPISAAELARLAREAELAKLSGNDAYATVLHKAKRTFTDGVMSAIASLLGQRYCKEIDGWTETILLTTSKAE